MLVLDAGTAFAGDRPTVGVAGVLVGVEAADAGELASFSFVDATGGLAAADLLADGLPRCDVWAK